MPAIADDLVQPFEIEPFHLRGRLVRLGPLLDEIVTRHDYPSAVAVMLGEAIALAVALSATLKYDGVFTLQTKGDGAIRLLVVDVTSAGAVRGYAQFDADRLAAVMAGSASASGSVPKLLGAGYLAFTVDQGEDTERYQGIVALEGGTLAECIHHYFRQSEQIAAGIKVAVHRNAAGVWRGGCLLVQRLPLEEGPGDARDALEDGWRRALILMGSSTSQELTDRDLSPAALLYRLFHEDGVRVFRTHGVRAECRCSRERIERVLRSFPTDERQDLGQDDGSVTVTCEFCNQSYRFEAPDLAAIAAG